MRVQRIVLVCTTALLAAGLTGVDPAAGAVLPTCERLAGRTIAENESWRIFQRVTYGKRSYSGTRRVETLVCRIDSRRVFRAARWTNSRAGSTRVSRIRFNGDYAAIGATYDSGFSAGTFVLLVNLPTGNRSRIEGPLAAGFNELLVSSRGSLAMVTTAGPQRSLDVYDGTGRRTLWAGDFSNVAVGDDVVTWMTGEGMKSAPLNGPAQNEVDAFASVGPG